MGNLCVNGIDDDIDEETKGEIQYKPKKAPNLSKYGTLTLVPSATKKGLRCYKKVNISAFCHNVKAVQQMAKQTRCEVIAVLKADAYGHGAIRIANECLKFGITSFAVATVVEGIELRKSSKNMMNKNIRIIILGAAVTDEYGLYSQFNLDLMLSGTEAAQSLINWAITRQNNENTINLHCMMDTGMARIGFQIDDCMDAIKLIHKNGSKLGLKFIALCTHFSDAPNEQYTLLQFDRFTSVLRKLDGDNINVEMFHCENSVSLMADVIENKVVESYMDHDTKGFVRIGGAFYGSISSDCSGVMSLHAQIRNIQEIKKGTPVGYGRTFIAEEDCLIATLSIGYGDGYPRGMSNQKKSIRIGDYLYDIAGRVSMDMMMVNLGNIEKNIHIKDIKIGDYAVLFGPKEEHEKNIQLEDMCKVMGEGYTNAEIICGFTTRCPTVYVD